MKIRVSASLLLLIYVIGCDNPSNSEDQTFYEGPAGVYKIEVIDQTDRRIKFKMFAVVPSPCSYHSRTELNQEYDDYYIKIYSRYDGEPCLGILVTIEVPVSVNVDHGENTIHFWQSDSANLDTTIFIQ